jgi:hypothetical protein
MFYPLITESKLISAKNRFPVDVNILNVWSPQNYIISELVKSLVKPEQKESVVEVVLDLDPESNDFYTLSNGNKILSSNSSKPKLPVSSNLNKNLAGFLTTTHTEHVTVADLYTYYNQEETW